MIGILRYTLMFLAVGATALLTVNGANAQDRPDKTERKVLVKVTTIENGDTTVTERELGTDDSDFKWVDEDNGDVVFITEDDDEEGEDDDVMVFSGKEGDVTVLRDGEGDDGDVVVTLRGLSEDQVEKLKSGKDGKPTKIIVRKMRSAHGGHGKQAKMDCCMESSSCCTMEKDGKHMKMMMKDMDRMHKKMMWKEKKEGDDDEEKEDDEDREDSEDDGNLP